MPPAPEARERGPAQAAPGTAPGPATPAAPEPPAPAPPSTTTRANRAGSSSNTAARAGATAGAHHRPPASARGGHRRGEADGKGTDPGRQLQRRPGKRYTMDRHRAGRRHGRRGERPRGDPAARQRHGRLHVHVGVHLRPHRLARARGAGAPAPRRAERFGRPGREPGLQQLRHRLRVERPAGGGQGRRGHGDRAPRDSVRPGRPPVAADERAGRRSPVGGLG